MDTELSITKLLLSRFEKYFLAEVKFFFSPFLMTRIRIWNFYDTSILITIGIFESKATRFNDKRVQVAAEEKPDVFE